MTGQFIFWSGLGSLIIDYFIYHRVICVLKTGSGQFFYVLLIILGLLLSVRAARKKKKKYTDLSSMQFAPISFRKRRSIVPGPIFLKILLFAVILIFCLTLPSGDVPASNQGPRIQVIEPDSLIQICSLNGKNPPNKLLDPH